MAWAIRRQTEDFKKIIADREPLDALLRLVFPVVVRVRISDGKITAADVLEEEFSEQLNSHELFNALPPDVFAAAHTGDCQAVRAFLADPRGDVNMRDRHAAVLARTVLPTSWANPPVHPNANPPGQAP